MRPWIASLCLVAFCSTSALAQDAAPPPDPKIDLAVKILQEIHALDHVSQALDIMLPQLVNLIKQQAPNLTDDQLKMVSDMMGEEMKGTLPKMITANARIYASHFTLDELTAIEQFYQSPAGQKVIAETPAIIKEGVPLGIVWGREAAAEVLPKVIEKLRAKGVKI
jgi:uncharacterized protein